MFSADGRVEGELDRRVDIAMSAAGAMQRNVFESRELSKKAKVEVYNTMVVPEMTYGCQSWVLGEREETRLQATEMSV